VHQLAEWRLSESLVPTAIDRAWLYKQTATEVVREMYRDLYGEVMIFTQDKKEESFIYSFTGHDRSWQFIRRDLLKE
jgi:hypothetical protein